MIRRFGWIALGTMVVLLGGLAFLLTQESGSQIQTLAAADRMGDQAITAQAVEPLAVVGNVQIRTPRSVSVAVNGDIKQVVVEVGDTVSAGGLLATVDTTYLDWAVTQAEINLELAQITLDEVKLTVDASRVAMAEATLLSAQEDLADLKIGPTDQQVAAAQATLGAARARYSELRAGPSQDRLNQLNASLEKAQIALTEAQRAYDEIAWRPDVGRTSQAAALQRATIDFQSAQATYNEAVKPADQSTLQSALASINSAEHNLNELQKEVTPGKLAVAQSRVMVAEVALKEIKEEEGDAALRQARLRLQQAEIGLAQAKLAQSQARVTAPISGVVISLDAEIGQPIRAGSAIAVIGDPADLEAVVNVDQNELFQVSVGAEVLITVFQSQDDPITGVVAKIAPISQPNGGLASYPVTIDLPDEGLEGFLPGMLVSVTFPQPEEEAVAPSSN